MEQLLTADEVRSICLPKRTFDIAKFNPFIDVAEKEFLKPFLGYDLYTEIRTQYLADNLTALNTTLVGYLKPALAWFVLHKALPFIHMDITNSGIQINNSEFASSGTDKQRGDTVLSALQIANTLLSEAKEYLEDVAADNAYPLYVSSDNVNNNTNIIG